jgi:hypothetical protein
MTPHELNQVALRVLSAWASGRKPTPEDSAAVRGQALLSEAHLPIDELACLLVKRVREQINADSEPDGHQLVRKRKIA